MAISTTTKYIKAKPLIILIKTSGLNRSQKTKYKKKKENTKQETTEEIKKEMNWYYNRLGVVMKENNYTLIELYSRFIKELSDILFDREFKETKEVLR